MIRVLRAPLLFCLLVLLPGAGKAHDQDVSAAIDGDSRAAPALPFVLAAAMGIEADSVPVMPGEPLFLEPNIPNPFNESTTIGYTLDRETSVTLAVYDQFYNLIEILVDDEFQTPGRYEETYDPAGSIASGWYFYSLKTSDGVLMRRMVHLH